ncbi:MAG: SpoIIE family protein phosphatase, partial [Actinobacteria bacterium]|nr:SpoIIE family protein phosphatase [Actinomycetota bacterium]
PGSGPALGALVVGFAEPRDFAHGECAFLEAVAGQCAVALERARLHEQAEQGQRRLAFLADVSGFLAGSLDPDVTLTHVADLAVPHLADWCAIHLLEGAGAVRAVALAHNDPGRMAEVRQWLDRFPVVLGAPVGTGAVLSTGRAEFYPELTPDIMATFATDPEHLEALTRNPFGAALILPLRARGRVLGAFTLVNDVGRRLADEDAALARELADRAAVAIDTGRLFADRTQVARRLQESLLPASLPSLPGIDLGARYRAAGEGLDVGGDFYDAFPMSAGQWMVAVGDVRGQGVDAAAVTGLARHTIRSAAVAGGTPRAILAHLNDVLLRHEIERVAGAPDDWETSEPRFLTVLLVSVTPTETGADLIICAAGHPLPLRLADGTVTAVGAIGTLVGIIPEVELAEVPVSLGPGDLLVCFTDGVIERHEEGRFMGEAGIATAMTGMGELDAAGVADLVESTALSFAESQPDDDMAVLVLRVPPGANR